MKTSCAVATVSDTTPSYTNTTEHIYPDPFGQALLHVTSEFVATCCTQPLLIHAYALAAVMPVICKYHSCHDLCVCAFIAMMHVASVCMHPRTASLAAGSSCQGPGHQEVMGEMLRQVETQCHKKARRLVWLEAIKPVFAVGPFTSLQCNMLQS